MATPSFYSSSAKCRSQCKLGACVPATLHLSHYFRTFVKGNYVGHSYCVLPKSVLIRPLMFSRTVGNFFFAASVRSDV